MCFALSARILLAVSVRRSLMEPLVHFNFNDRVGAGSRVGTGTGTGTVTAIW